MATTQYIRYPAQGSSGGSGIPTYATFASFPASATDGAAAIALDTDTLYIYNAASTTWKPVASPGTVLSIGSPTHGLSITANALSIALASTSATGALSNTDWNTFNGKQSALTFGTLSDAGTDGIVITNGGGAVIGSGTSIAQHVADTSHNGYLSSTDWNTFNGKQPSGTYVTALTIASSNGFAGSSSGGATPALTLTTSITGVLKGNGTAISAATSGTDYSAGTSALATGILKSTTSTGALTIAIAADFPTLNQNTSGTAAGLSATLAVASGGTGQITAAAAFNALSPITTTGDIIYSPSGATSQRLGIGSNGNVLTVVSGVPAWAPPAGGSGTVTSVTFTGDGTVLSSTPSSAVTTTGTVAATLLSQSANTYLCGPASGSSAVPTFKAFRVPVIQKFKSMGSTTGYLFTITTSSTCAVGDTYTNNGNTYTVQNALAGVTGQVLWCSQASAPQASGNLTRASGAGTATIAFTSAAATGTITPATGSLYARLIAIGGGGGSSGSGTAGGTAAGAGGLTAVGPNLHLCPGGAQGVYSGATVAAGGVPTIGAGATGLDITGGPGGGGGAEATSTTYVQGGAGGQGYFGGGGMPGGSNSTPGVAGTANTGSGASGAVAAGVTSLDIAGNGGAAGGFLDILITPLAASYPYILGQGGSAGGAGASGSAGAAGGSGVIEWTDYFQ